MRPAALSAIAALVAAAPAGAQPRAVSEADIEEHLGARLPLDTPLTDQDGRPVRLGDYFRDGKPVVVVLAYYRCAMLCDLVLRGAVESTARQGLVLGRDFRGLTISFDPRDTPKVAANRQRGTLQALPDPESAAAAWPFLVGRESDTRAIADRLGFQFAFDERSGQYAHPACMFVLTPDGTISRYLYGLKLRPFDVRLAIDEAARGNVGRIVDRVLLTCFRYDPATRRYGLFVRNLLRIGATCVLVAVGAFLFVQIRRERRLTGQRRGDEANV